MIPPKMNNDIPDSLESVVTVEQQTRMMPPGRDRGRGRGGMMRGARGGRFPQSMGNFNPRFMSRGPFDNQPPQFRPPMQPEPRPPHFPNGPVNHMNPPMMYNQESPQFAPFPPGGPPRGPRPHFNEPRPFNPNQFQGPMPRPPMDFRPRGPMPPPRFNGPHPPFSQQQQQQQHPFHRPPLDMQPGPMMRPPMHMDGPPMPFRPPAPHPPGFEPRIPYQEPQYETRPVYDPRPPYQPPVSQFNPNPPVAPPHPPVNPVPSMPQGHKILINPHFRGNPQPPAEGRPPWDGAQQPPPANEPYGQNQNTYGGQPSSYSASASQHSSQDFEKNYSQPKTDDPYAYFSDVWQENKTKLRSSSPPKNYSGDSYGRDSSYRDYEKYKDSRDSYQDDQRYRDRSPPPRLRDHPPARSRGPSNQSNYHNESYDQRPSRPLPANSTRPPVRTVQKRSPEPQERPTRDISAKRARLVNRSPPGESSSESNRNVKEEIIDPEELEYRKKMEEQKRLREKILQEKENRRKQAALDKQIDESKDAKSSDTPQETKSSVISLKESSEAPSVKARVRPGTGQPSEVEKPKGLRIVRAIPEKSQEPQEPLVPEKKPVPTRRVVIQKQLVPARVATTLQKTVSNLQKTQGNTQNSATDTIVKKVTLSLQKNARTVVDRTTTVRKVVVGDGATIATAKKIPGTVQSNRIVLPKSSQAKQISVGKSNTISIENLAASTTETQIRRMCQGIGTVENISMGDGTATIVFKTHSAAMVFHNKYQRKMIDLSMINVKFLPQTEISRTA